MNDSYIAVTSHSINSEWELKQRTLAVKHLKERHSASYLASELTSVLEEKNIKDVIVTTDNGANIKAAVKLNNWPRFPCFAHTINLAVQSGLETSEIQPTMEKAKTIVRHFKHSSVAYCKLKEAATCLRETDNTIGKCTALVQEVPTRWNSAYDMMNHLIALKPAVMAPLTDEQMIPTTAEWKIMQKLCDILEPIKVSSETLSADTYPTMGMTYPSVMKILADLEINGDDLAAIKMFKTAVQQNINDHFNDETQRDLIEVCCFIDPWY